MSKKQKSERYRGIYIVAGTRGVSYGIDYIHPQTGQRVQKILKHVTSEKEAHDLREMELADARRGAIKTAYGIRGKPRTISFESMIDAYLKWSRENKGSWETDEHRAKPLRKAFKGKLMSDINPFLGEKYKMARDKEVNKKTVNKELILARQIFDKAIEWKKYDGENPFDKVPGFKVKKGKKPGALSPEEVLAIQEEIDHPIKRDMVGFAYYAGWRISEIRKLKWEDLNLETGSAWIVDSKNGETVEVDLGDEALEIVTRQKQRGPYVFCHKNGKPYRTNLHDVIKNAAKRAGIELPPRKAWHIFRRTWASMFLQNGGDVETLRVQGNWKDHTMPLWYSEAGNKEYRRAILNRIPKLQNGRNVGEMDKVVSINIGKS